MDFVKWDGGTVFKRTKEKQKKMCGLRVCSCLTYLLIYWVWKQVEEVKNRPRASIPWTRTELLPFVK